jgi:hypothetical protein
VLTLYSGIEEMLQDLISSGDVKTRTFVVQIFEDLMEPYSVPVLELTVGSDRVEFRPKSMRIIGAEGRVDLRGDRDTVMLLKEEGGWFLVMERSHPRFAPSNRESLKTALERVMLP